MKVYHSWDNWNRDENFKVVGSMFWRGIHFYSLWHNDAPLGELLLRWAFGKHSYFTGIEVYTVDQWREIHLEFGIWHLGTIVIRPKQFFFNWKHDICLGWRFFNGVLCLNLFSDPNDYSSWRKPIVIGRKHEE